MRLLETNLSDRSPLSSNVHAIVRLPISAISTMTVANMPAVSAIALPMWLLAAPSYSVHTLARRSTSATPIPILSLHILDIPTSNRHRIPRIQHNPKAPKNTSRPSPSPLQLSKKKYPKPTYEASFLQQLQPWRHTALLTHPPTRHVSSSGSTKMKRRTCMIRRT